MMQTSCEDLPLFAFAQALVKPVNQARVVSLPNPVIDLSRGWCDGDEIPECEFRDALMVRVKTGIPIFPNRKLGMEFAAMSRGLPRGVPVAGPALANLRPGDQFRDGDWSYHVEKIGSVLVMQVTEANGRISSFRTKPEAKNWEQFERDMDGLLNASIHGVDAGDLAHAWLRDPVSIGWSLRARWAGSFSLYYNGF